MKERMSGESKVMIAANSLYGSDHTFDCYTAHINLIRKPMKEPKVIMEEKIGSFISD